MGAARAGFHNVDKLLPVAVMPASALVEALYRARERGHRLPSAQLRDDLLGLGVRVEPVTDADTVRAADLIEASRAARTEADSRCLSLGDGLCLAAADA
jgi:PIN domain nuclease of toxin-antitoxin system